MPLQKSQVYKICHSLRDNLLNYPESKILRELVQNSEDSKADKVTIKIDTRTYDSNGNLLLDANGEEIETSKELFGPSLLIYNNSTFEDKDWEGIAKMGEGSKKNDLNKVGSFGLGWCSVYHVTDFPIVLSNDRIWFLDPSEVMGGGLIYSLKDENDINLCKGLFEPFEQFKESNFNLDECIGDSGNNYNGTIIRLPLRLSASEIKASLLTIDSLKEILMEFAKDIAEIPIFLKRISSITLMFDDDVVASVEISNNLEIKKEREKISTLISNIISNEMKDPSDVNELSNILVNEKEQSDFISNFQIDLKVIKNNQLSQLFSYLVFQGVYINEDVIELTSNSKKVKLISYGGTALPINNSNNTPTDQFRGKPFTFLPIGGLIYNIPLHINGYFQLSNARDKVVYSRSTVAKASETIANNWNSYISKTIIPFFYKESLEFMKSNYREELYSYFPYKCDILQYQGEGPEYDISIKTMEFIISGKYFSNIFDHGQYLSLDESVIISDSEPDFIIQLLKEKNQKVIKIPTEILQHLENRSIKLKYFSKQFICDLLKSSPLTKYSSDILNYLCDSRLIQNKQLDSIGLLPVDHITSGSSKSNAIGCLFTGNTYRVPYNYVYIPSDQIFDLLCKFYPNLPYHLKLSNMPDNFKNNILSIKKVYTNIQEINLSTFLSLIKKSGSNNYSNVLVKEIWKSLNELRKLEVLYTDHISSLNIIPFRSNSSTVQQYTSYDVSNLLKFNTNLLGIESCLNKLNIYLVQEGHTCNLIIDSSIVYHEFSKLLSFLTNKSNRLKLLLNNNEIDRIREYLVSNLSAQFPTNDNNFKSFKDLPVHPCIGDINNKYTSITNSSEFVDLNGIEKYEIKGIVLIKLGQISRSSNLLNSLGVKSILNTRQGLFRNYLIKNIQQFKISLSIEIIQQFITEFSDHYANDNYLRDNSWIPSIEGAYSKPSSYYVLSAIESNLVKQVNPGKIIHDSLLRFTQYLIKFGLNTSIPVSYILDNIPKRIARSEDSVFNDFLMFLESRNIASSDLDSIRTIKFIPSSLIETYDGYGSQESYLSLSECTLSTYKDILFTCKKPIKIDKKNPIYSYLENKKEYVIQHWNNLNSLDYNQEISFDPNTVFNSLYKEIDNNLKSDKYNDQQINQIKGIDRIWSNNKFISTRTLFTNSYNNDINYFEPYYHVYKKVVFKSSGHINLFKLLNIKSEPDSNDYYLLIKIIQHKFNNQVIPDKEIGLIITSLNKIGNKTNEMEFKLPNRNNYLIEFDKVVYGDCPAIPDYLIDKGYQLLHGNISENTAFRLQITRLSQLIQEGSAFENDFGQKEELVPRLKSILKDYRAETFMNEMVQNAHDSNASKVKLILDYNSSKFQYIKDNPTRNTKIRQDFPNYLDSSLLFYNNSVFTDKDIDNIQVLSATYKKFENSKVGMNGLGFTSVYGFSDCPSILSGEWLMIFDPYVTHINPSRSYKPGAKYRLSHYKSHPELFKPFEHLQSIFNFNFEDGKFNGTIIRLPLRKQLNSDRFVSKSEWSEPSILKYFEDIKNNNVENLMLFTGIKSIEIATINAKTINNNQIGLKSIILVEKESNLSLISQPFDKLLIKIPLQVSEYSFKIIDSSKSQPNERIDNYIVGQSIDDIKLFNLKNYPNSTILKFLSIYNTEKRRPIGGVAFKLPNSYGLSSGFKPKSFCYLPYKELISNIPTHIHGHFSTTSSRDIFEVEKGMSLPITDPLTIKLSNQQQQTEAFLIYWNQLLISEIIIPVYLNTLLLFKYNRIGESIEENYDFYYSLFPKKDKESDISGRGSVFQNLIKGFYSSVHEKKLDIFLAYPGYPVLDHPLDTYYTSIEFTDIESNSSVLKCLSHLNNNINVIPISNYKDLEIVKPTDKNQVSANLLSQLLIGEELDPQVITTQDICNLLSFFYSNTLFPHKLLDKCQLLILNDSTREFIDISNNKQQILYNPEYIEQIGDSLNLKFLDSNLSDFIKNNLEEKWYNMLLIFDHNFVNFYFNYLLPNFNVISEEMNINLLKRLLNCFVIVNNVSGVKKVEFNLFKSEQIGMLKESTIFPYINKNGIKEFTSISKLFAEDFRSYDFVLDYIDSSISEEYIPILKFLGIKTILSGNDVVNQFKKISVECYKGEVAQDVLVNRARYLWSIAIGQINDVFDSIIELNIVPTVEGKYVGSKKKGLCLSKLTETTTPDLEGLYFSVKHISDIRINYPLNYSRFDYPLIFENFTNLLNNVNEWPRVNHKFDPTIFNLLISMCRELNLYDGTFSNENIRRIPVPDTHDFVDFQNIVMNTDSNSLSPFFNILPPIFNNYGKFFGKLGVKQLNMETIINRFNECLHQEFGNSKSTINFLYSLLLNNYSDQLKTMNNLPVFTKNCFFKPSNQVLLFDTDIKNRIKLNTGLFYEINSILKGHCVHLKVSNLSSVIVEELDTAKTDLNYEPYNESLSEFINKLLKNVNFISKVEELNISQILKIKVKSGIIHTKFIYKNDGQDITNQSKSNCFYDNSNSTLYLNYGVSKKEALSYLFDAIELQVPRNNILILEKEFIDNPVETVTAETEPTTINEEIIDSASENDRKTQYWKNYNDLARTHFDAAVYLSKNQSFNNLSTHHYFISIEMSIKSLFILNDLEIQNSSLSHLRNRIQTFYNNITLPTITPTIEGYKFIHLSNTNTIDATTLESFKSISSSFLNLSNSKQ